MILYVPLFTTMFSITALNGEEWKWVLLISMPVLVLDEWLKWMSRNMNVGGSVDQKKKD
jgi:Ca2+ transporting ATPase